MAGELVEVNYHLEIRGLLHGPSTPFSWDESGWGGLGAVNVKATADVDLDERDGTFLGPTYLASRVLTFPVRWGGSGAADVMLDLLDLQEAWAPSTEDLELVAMLPGWGKFRVVGQPRGLTDDLSRMPKGEGAALLTFLAGDPRIVFGDVVGS